MEKFICFWVRLREFLEIFRYMKEFDAVIIGAGLAGLECARLLSRQGAKVLLVDRKSDLTKGNHTPGIFVRKPFQDFDFPADTRGKPVRDVTLYSPALRPLPLGSKYDEFRVGKMGALYEAYLREAIANGVEFSNGTRYISSVRVRAVGAGGQAGNQAGDQAGQRTENIVTLAREGEPFFVKAKVLVGADGARSRVAKDLGLDENKEVIVGYEEVYRGVPLAGEARLHCFLGGRLGPGDLAWVTNDGEEVHIGVGGYAEKFDPRTALKEFKQKIAGKVIDLSGAELAETRGGKNAVGGVLG